ncbi:RNA polymerase sigma factor [Coprococcus sp. NSJ-10]|uniref:RNA polymerase sigma factor n=1 Tax=Coprococcus hominis (ex Liu et al. 2022) TaxID=2763039 RepID=A0A8I0AH10_9FIRM|nr:RNA polymerase sigma factor [Coprococcus hominis (ex Liu et al. 2022)]MBC5661352.1 RNA polymerase sigma factor [Coprococcus hominis (ex Liu et al. 2022)]
MICKTCGNDLQGNEYNCPFCGAAVDYTEAVEQAKAGREEGFSYLYEMTYRNKLYIAMKYMKNEDEAMDVLHDSYVKAFERLSGLQDANSFPGWLSTIVANTARNALRDRHTVNFSDMQREDQDGETFEYSIADENMTAQPEMACTTKETQEMVQELIGSLSDEQRMCVLMFHIEGYSIKDIATVLGCSENTVKSRLNYGRKNIKAKAEELQKKGYKLYSYTPMALLTYLLMAERGGMLVAGTFDKLAGVGSVVGAGLIHGGAAGALSVAGSAATAGGTGVAGAAGSAAGTGAAAGGKTAAATAAKQTFLKTVAGKITMAAAGVAVAGGAAGVAIYNHNQNTWQDAYTEVLKEYRQEIQDYGWQTSQMRENEPTLVGESRAITVADIMGDDTPELIFAVQDESDPNKADLYIYTYIDNEAIQVYSGELDTRSDENRDKWGSEGTPYVLVCTREVSENGCRMYILCSDGQSDNTEIGVIDKMIEFDVASSSGDYLQPIVWTCHAEQVGDEETALLAERDGISVAWEEYQTKRDEIYQEVDSEVLKNMAATAPYGIYDQLADINRDSSGNIMAGRNLGGVSDGCEMSYADALKYFKESK